MPDDVFAAKRKVLSRERSWRDKNHYSNTPLLRRFAFSTASIFASGKQFTTSSFISQPLRAAPMPNHKSCKRAVRWASGLITHRTPFSFASGHQRQSRSSRFGAALSSIQVPVSAAASSTAGMLMAYPSRFKSKRPVGCASIVTNGFEIARMTRFVISASLRLNVERTEATTKSRSAKISSSNSPQFSRSSGGMKSSPRARYNSASSRMIGILTDAIDRDRPLVAFLLDLTDD